MEFSRGKYDAMVKNHGLPLLSSLPERFAWRYRFAPSVDRLGSGLSPVGNALPHSALRGGYQSFCLIVQSTIGGGTCAFGGFREENSLLTIPSVIDAVTR